ncbi:MAG: FMN reductase (NAD(P)H) [bacterium ADurb.Bin429]|nr:MAG: FMN reductase (NAD(P)H) [bacterium ADurb.Bin429]
MTYWLPLVRKYAHILDKGLQRCDCAPGHSTQIYQRAKEALSHIPTAMLSQDASLQWAAETISCYEQLQTGCHATAPAPLTPTVCMPTTLLDAMVTRRSIRQYTDTPVSPETVMRIAEVINWVPTSCNRQPARIFATVDPELTRACASTCKGATCFTKPIPAFLAFCADIRAYTWPVEYGLPYVDVALGMQNCCLMAHALGASITLLSWAQCSAEEERRLRACLEIPDHYQIIANGILGYPARGVTTPARKSIDETCVIRGAEQAEAVEKVM